MNRKEGLYARNGVVYRRIHRPSKEAVDAIAGSSVSDVLVVLGNVLGYRMMMRPGLRPIRPGQRTVGPAITAFQYPSDNLMTILAYSLAEPGDVIVVNSFWSHAAQWGANAASFARAHGLAGLIVDGAVRDTDEVARQGFPVWATTIAPVQPDKGSGAGAINIPICCAGVIVNPGDLIVADDDGVIVVPREIADDIGELAAKKTKLESAKLVEFATPSGPPIDQRFAEHYKRFAMKDYDRAWDES